MAEATGTTEDWDDFYRVFNLFHEVREFVAQKFPKLKKIDLNPFCREILAFRKEYAAELKGRRAMMHVAHHPNVVCAWIPATLQLSTNHLIGLYLHEFGHLGSQGGDVKADRWVKEKLGIKILYGGPLDLEWVSREDGLKALSVPSTPPRPRRRHPRR